MRGRRFGVSNPVVSTLVVHAQNYQFHWQIAGAHKLSSPACVPDMCRFRAGRDAGRHGMEWPAAYRAAFCCSSPLAIMDSRVRASWSRVPGSAW